MDDDRFDRLTRSIATGVTRRRLLAAAAGALALRGSGAGAQLGPSTCAQAGAVCTMLMGCCQGLTCVTSAINVNYGICVTGSGGTVSTGTTLISPFSDGAADEAVGLASTSTTTTSSTTDPQVLRQQKIAQRKSRRSARKSKQSSRRTTRKSNRQTQKNERQLRRGPKLDFQVTKQGTVDEALRVKNLEGTTVYLFGIAPLNDLGQGKQFNPTYALGAGASFLFLSGKMLDWDRGSTFAWHQPAICQGNLEENGFVVTAATSSGSVKSHDYTILCDGTRLTTGRGKRKNHHKPNRKPAHKKRKSGKHG